MQQEQEITEQQAIPEILRPVEPTLRVLWEKIQQAVTLISTLRAEKNGLVERVQELETKLTELHNQNIVKNLEVEQLRKELEQVSKKEFQAIALSNEEKHYIKQRIHELLERINSHLQTPSA